jgi:molecular chaperone HtpG
MIIVNASYTYDEELISKYSNIFHDETVEKMDPQSLSHNLEELTLDEQTECFDFLRLADIVLLPFQCGADLKKFAPEALPTLYSNNSSADALRAIEQSKAVSAEIWSALLDTLASAGAQDPSSQLCFNHNNPLVRKVARMKDKQLLQRIIEMLYVQALLLGHHPLSLKEMTILNEGLLSLIDASLVSSE